MNYRILYIVDGDFGLASVGRTGELRLDETGFEIDSEPDVSVSYGEISDLRIFKQHGVGTGISIQTADQSIHLTVPRVSLFGFFAMVDRSKTRQLFTEIATRTELSVPTPPVQPYSIIRAAILGIAIGLVILWLLVLLRRNDALIVYCAHDLIFAQQILDDFENETGIKVVVVGDTEATKSLGLVQRLVREKDNPKCDVFWNNQVLGTVELAEAGVLQPYHGVGFERIPKQFKDPDGLWTGFAGRLRVWIVNTEKLAPDESEILARYQSEDLSRMAIAMPLYGTTLTHFSILWDELGGEKMKAWFADLKSRGCQIVPGNATVKNVVAEGVCDFGWTDTDDFFVGEDAGYPVAMLPIRIDGETICQPNSVAMIRGTKQRDKAAKLIDYLLSENVELALANSASRQIPLGPVDSESLPADVKPLYEWAKDSVNVTEYASARGECLRWLQEIYTNSN